MKCGMCCDGSMFKWVGLETGEKENLSSEIPVISMDRDGAEGFNQPCPVYHGKCTIYHSYYPNVCRSFRCDLLDDFSKDRISQTKALKIAEKADSLRSNIRVELSDMDGIDEKVPLYVIIEVIEKLQVETEDNREFIQDKQALIKDTRRLQQIISTNFKRPPGILNRIKIFYRIPLSEKRLFVEAVILLYSTKFILLTLPLKYCDRLFGYGSRPESGLSSECQLSVRTAIGRAGKVVFWKNRSRAESLATNWMLQRRS